MQILFDRQLKRSSLYREILAELRKAIRDGRLKPGEQLPSERELANAFGTSRVAVRQALVALEVSGMVEVRPGSGTFLKAFELNDFLEPLSYLVYGSEAGPLDILELRMALETSAAALAAERATPEDIRNISAAIEQQAKAIAAGERATEEDIEIHQAIARATHNELIHRVMLTIGALLVRAINEYRQATWSLPGRARAVQSEHEAIRDAIAARDADRAREAMRQHLEGRRRDLIEVGIPVTGGGSSA